MKYTLQSNVISVDMGDELLLSSGKDKVLQLSGTSRTILETALEAKNIEDIVSAICNEYEVDINKTELLNDINDCINMLIQNEILACDNN